MNRDRNLGAAIFALISATVAFGYLSDSAAHYPNPLVQPIPGRQYRDPTFNTAAGGAGWIWRITDSRHTSRADGVPGNLTQIAHEYSTTSAFNSNRTRLLLIHQAYFALYDGKGQFVRNLVLVCASCSPRWSRTDPNVFYYTKEPGVYRYDAQTDTHTLAAKLTYEMLITKGEDDICFDGDHLIGFGKRGANYFLYVFSISKAGVVAEQLIGDREAFGNVDSAEIAPDDIVMVSYVARDADLQGLASHGVWAFDLSLNPLRPINSAGGHHDVGRDVDGSPILVMSNSGGYQPLANCPNGVEKISINLPSKRQCLLALHWTLPFHVSLPDQNGWAFVSTYAPGDPMPGTMGRKEEASPTLTFSEGWNVDTRALHSGGKAKWSSNDASKMTFWFFGTSFRWIASKDSSSGIAQISIDNETDSVDLYSKAPVNQAVVYRRDSLPPFKHPNMPLGFHRVIIDVTNTKNHASSGYKVWIDAVEEDTPWMSYTNEILQVRLDGGEVRRLAHHRSRALDTYEYMPKASSTRDGRSLVFTSNYGTDYTDAYLMEIN